MSNQNTIRKAMNPNQAQPHQSLVPAARGRFPTHFHIMSTELRFKHNFLSLCKASDPIVIHTNTSCKKVMNYRQIYFGLNLSIVLKDIEYS